MKTVLHVLGARPNYMKVAPIVNALRPVDLKQVLVDTGQHYDDEMAGIFRREFGLPEPDFNLKVGSASHAVQTAMVMTRFEQVCLHVQPDLVIVVGDVNSTLAATLVASKLLVRVAHVEAGLRSHDRTMPEEVNRLVTDRLADILFAPSQDAVDKLLREGIARFRIKMVGNVMIDTLLRCLPRAGWDRLAGRFQVTPREYAVLTLHRPSNVDHPEKLAFLLSKVAEVATQVPVVFPVHPRTRGKIAWQESPKGIVLCPPLGYLDFLALTSNARVVMTDSGGLQEETTALGIPCLTLRDTTERPVTVTHGSNVVVRQIQDIPRYFEKALSWKDDGERPPLWDGHAAERIASAVTNALEVS